MEHTKLPWKLYSGKLVPEYPNKIVEVQDENGKAICKWTGFDGADQSPTIRKANAAFIVRACNCHDELLETCKMALDYLPAKDGKSFTDDPDSQIQLIICNKLKAAIAKAGDNDTI